MPVLPKLAERRFWQNRHTGDVSKHSEMYMKNEKRYAQRLSRVSEWGGRSEKSEKREKREKRENEKMKNVLLNETPMSRSGYENGKTLCSTRLQCLGVWVCCSAVRLGRGVQNVCVSRECGKALL